MMMFGLKLSSLLSRSSLVSWSLRAWISRLPPHLGVDHGVPMQWKLCLKLRPVYNFSSEHQLLKSRSALGYPDWKECTLCWKQRRGGLTPHTPWSGLICRWGSSGCLQLPWRSAWVWSGSTRPPRSPEVSDFMLMMLMNPTSSWSPQQSQQHTSVLKLWPSCHLPLWVQPSNLSPGNQPHLLGLLAWQMDKQQTDDMVQNMWFHPPVGGI